MFRIFAFCLPVFIVFLSPTQASEALIPAPIPPSLKVEFAKKVKSFSCFTLDAKVVKELYTGNAAEWQLSLPLPNGEVKKIDLARKDIFTPNFQIKTSGGVIYKDIFSQAAHYQGKVAGEPASIAAFSLSPTNFSGIFSFGSGNYNLVKIRKSGLDLYALYNERDILEKNPFECHTDKLNSSKKETRISPLPYNKRGGGDDCRRVGLYLECDHQMFTDNGNSVPNTVNFVTSLFNVVSGMYAEEGIALRLSEMMVHTQPDNYPNMTSHEALFAFTDSVAMRPPFQGNLAHLLSTIPNANGGVAFLDVLCSSGTGYSNIYPSFLPLPYYSWDVNVVTHELGHNFGSPHTQNCDWEISPGIFGMIDSCYIPEGECYQGPRIATAGTQMSYCHLMNLGIDMSKGFGPLPGELILSKFHEASCLEGAVELGSLAITRPDTFCAGTSVSLSVTQVAGASYLWSGPAGFSSTLPNPVVSAITPAKAGEYTVVVTKQQCSSAPLTTRLSVNCVHTIPQANHTICLPGSFSVDYLATVVPLAGNVFTVQLSNASGSFANPTSIGTLSSIQKKGSIAVNLPQGFLPDSGFRIRITTSNPGSIGEASDQPLMFTPQPEAPVAIDASLCQPGVFTLNAAAPGTIYWYNQVDGLVPIASGNSFSTPSLSTTTSYWVASRVEQKEQVGAIANLGVSDTLSVFNTYHGLFIRVKKQVVLDSVTVYPGASGVLNFNVKDSSNTFYYKTLQIPVQGNIEGEKVKIGLELSPGVYRVDAEGSTVPTLLRLNNFNSFPLVSNGLDIIGSSVNSRYYFFFDWKTRTIGCLSKRKEVKAIALETPQAPTTTGENHCGPASVTISASGALTGQSYVWYLTSTGATAIPGQVSNSYVTPTLSASTTYYVSISGPGNCESTRQPVLASILSAPPTPLLSLGAGYLIASPDTVLLWYKNNTLLGLFGDSLAYTAFGDGSYFVVHKRENGCAAHSDTLLVTEIDESLSNLVGFEAFPNPGDGLFTLRIPRSGYSQVQCYDVVGKSLFSQSLMAEKQQVDLRYLPAGLYLLSIRGASGVATLRVRKE